MSSAEAMTTTESEAAAAQAATIRERKKRRQKQILANAELDLILHDLQQELQQLNVKKKECISNAAERMASVVPKEMVAKELVQGLKSLNYKINRQYIYQILGDLWPEVYSRKLSENRQIDEDRDTEESAKRLIQQGLVTQEEIEKGPATMDFHRDFYNESEIELDSGILYELQIAMRNYPDKIVIMQQKGKAIEITKIIGRDSNE
jgi:hypothetical protein